MCLHSTRLAVRTETIEDRNFLITFCRIAQNLFPIEVSSNKTIVRGSSNSDSVVISANTCTLYLSLVYLYLGFAQSLKVDKKKEHGSMLHVGFNLFFNNSTATIATDQLKFRFDHCDFRKKVVFCRLIMDE